jgi:hypothetical protein
MSVLGTAIRICHFDALTRPGQIGSLSIALGLERPLGTDKTSETHPRCVTRRLRPCRQAVVQFWPQSLYFLTF